VPETRQHFFLFFPDFLFLSLFGSPATLDAKAKRRRTFYLNAQKRVNTFFKEFFDEPRGWLWRQACRSGNSSVAPACGEVRHVW
jgi:hypothetical protein